MTGQEDGWLRRRARLIHAETPIEVLQSTGARLGVTVVVKRDDLTGFGLSGNKVRKLELLLAEALADGATTVLTTGGIQSNHCRATSVAARRLGLVPRLLLRGEAPEGAGGVDSNLLIDMMMGAELRWTDPAGYRRRDALLADWAGALAARGERPVVIPEGGSNALGALGFVGAGRTLARQLDAAGIRPTSVVCPVGSGGTLAGLAMAGLPCPVVGVAVCDDRATFRARVQEIGAAAQARFGCRLPAPGPGTWDVLEGYQGLGYARARPVELAAQVRLARETGLILDPVYTGKAWFAVESELSRQGHGLGDTVVFWHTGGGFGVFGRGAEYGPVWR